MAHGFIADEYERREDAYLSYQRQQTTLELPSGRWRLESSDEANGEFPFADTVHLVSAWHPNGFPASRDQNKRYTTDLTKRITDAGGSTLSAVAHGRDRGWFESTLVVSGVDRHTVIDLAAEFGAPAYLEWTRDELRVLPVARPIERFSSRWILTRVDRSCALKPDAAIGDRCERRGGPWVGASIERALASALKHADAYELVGCDTCHGEQRTETPGRAIGMTTTSAASRWCGLTTLGCSIEAIRLTGDY